MLVDIMGCEVSVFGRLLFLCRTVLLLGMGVRQGCWLHGNSATCAVS
jgi:hypothetical protein